MICDNAIGVLLILGFAISILTVLWIARSEKMSLWDAFVSTIWFQRDVDEPMVLWPARLIGITLLFTAFTGLLAICPDFPALLLPPTR